MKLRPFELTLIVIFGLLMVGALLMLKLYKPAPEPGATIINGPVMIWGTLPAEPVVRLLRDLGEKQEAYRKVSYRYVPPDQFDDSFTNALADGTPPDLLLISQESLVQNRSRLEPVSYTIFPARDYRSLYIDGADIFALSDGIYAYPIVADPLMMYWNRDLFAFNNLIVAPSTWEEVVSEVVPKLTIRDVSRNITQSGIAMGEYSNVKNSFAILSMLILQGGSALVTEDGRSYDIRLEESVSSQSTTRPFSAAATFFTNFSSVPNTLYAWDKSLPEDRELFLREQLALYFGFGSEAREIESRNPNLSFDIAAVPQGAGATTKRTYARFYGLAVPRSAKNKTGAYTVRQELASQTNAKIIAEALDFAPTHRTSLLAGSNDIYLRAIYQALPTARGWLSPRQQKSDEVLARYISEVNADRSQVSFATSDALKSLEAGYY